MNNSSNYYTVNLIYRRDIEITGVCPEEHLVKKVLINFFISLDSP